MKITTNILKAINNFLFINEINIPNLISITEKEWTGEDREGLHFYKIKKYDGYLFSVYLLEKSNIINNVEVSAIQIYICDSQQNDLLKMPLIAFMLAYGGEVI